VIIFPETPKAKISQVASKQPPEMPAQWWTRALVLPFSADML
jgi:hypothetical protein